MSIEHKMCDCLDDRCCTHNNGSNASYNVSNSSFTSLQDYLQVVEASYMPQFGMCQDSSVLNQSWQSYENACSKEGVNPDYSLRYSTEWIMEVVKFTY